VDRLRRRSASSRRAVATGPHVVGVDDVSPAWLSGLVPRTAALDRAVVVRGENRAVSGRVPAMGVRGPRHRPEAGATCSRARPALHVEQQHPVPQGVVDDLGGPMPADGSSGPASRSTPPPLGGTRCGGRKRRDDGVRVRRTTTGAHEESGDRWAARSRTACGTGWTESAHQHRTPLGKKRVWYDPFPYGSRIHRDSTTRSGL